MGIYIILYRILHRTLIPHDPDTTGAGMYPIVQKENFSLAAGSNDRLLFIRATNIKRPVPLQAGYTRTALATVVAASGRRIPVLNGSWETLTKAIEWFISCHRFYKNNHIGADKYSFLRFGVIAYFGACWYKGNCLVPVCI